MGGYLAYAEYKESGVEWLGKIPTHWDAKRLKFSVSLINEKIDAESSELSYMGLEHIRSWSGERIEGEEASSQGIASRFIPNDVLFGKLRPYLAKVFLSKHEGLASTEALILRSKNELIPDFLRYYIVSRNFIDVVDSSTFGTKMPRASWEFIGNLSLLVPPLEEQRSIARFLDYKTAQIDALIAKKETLLKKLAEKRTALISQAVTKGLDRTVPMKDSGIEWLGEIPAHWKPIRLKFLILHIEGGFSPQCYSYPPSEDEWGVLKTGCVNGGVFNPQASKTLPENIEPPSELEVQKGNILMSRASGSIALVGSVAIVSQQPTTRLLLSDKTFRLSLNPSVCDAIFFVLTMGSSIVRQQIHQVISGAEGLANNIAQSSIRELILSLPPLPEQQEISQFLGNKILEAENQMQKVSQAIQTLKEYRTALITNAVTGKIDVRDVILEPVVKM